jgi:hypothetical protein
MASSQDVHRHIVLLQVSKVKMLKKIVIQESLGEEKEKDAAKSLK